MNPSSCIAQRTRARKFQEHFKKVEKLRGSSTSEKGKRKGANDSGNSTTIFQINEESDRKMLKSKKMLSSTDGREKKQITDVQMNTGQDKCFEDDNDDIEILGEAFAGDRTNQDEVDIDEKTQDVVYIDDSTSDEGEAEENATRKCHFNENKSPKISLTKTGSSSSAEEDVKNTNSYTAQRTRAEDIVLIGVQRVENPGMLFKGTPGRKRNTGTVDKVSAKHPKTSKNIAESTSLSGEGGLDSKEEDGAESTEEEDDSTGDEDFNMEIKDSSSSVDSSSSSAEESDEDFYVFKRRSVKNDSKRTSTEELSGSEHGSKGKRFHSKKRKKMDTSTGSSHKRGSIQQKSIDSQHRSKGKSFDRSEPKKMETSVESSQKSSDEVTATKVIFQAGEAVENANPGDNVVNETESMGEEINERVHDLQKSTPTNPLCNEEDSTGEMTDDSHLKEQELTDMEKQKNVPSASQSNTKCSKFCQECGARKVISDTDDTELNGREVSAGKEKATESCNAKKATRNTAPNVGGQIEGSLRKRSYPALSRQQKRYSSTSFDEKWNNTQSMNLSEKQSEDNQAKRAPASEAAIEDSVKKRSFSDGRDDGPFKNLQERQSENVFRQEEETAWFTKARLVKKKEKDFFKVLADAILREDDSIEAPSQQEDKPSSSSLGHSFPWKFRFEDEEPKVRENSAYENMVAGLFSELKHNWTYESMDTFDLTLVENETAKASSSEENQIHSCGDGRHDLVRNEEIGDICRICHCIVNEIRDILPDFAKISRRTSGKSSAEKENFLVPEGVDVSTIMENQKESYNRTDGTVWSIIPGVRKSLYKHQQDGFEFLWKNLAGTMDLDELKGTVPKDVGGCIISHAPGTGKTRLSIVFVQSYLRLFPDSLPVIIAPASMLLTWEEEFKKWDIEFPFHNLCNPEFSGKESKDLLKIFTMSRSQDNSKVRWVKIFTWRKGGSILGISYNLYEKFSGEKVAANEESENLRRILLQLPKLVVLDEGHIPRNQTSSIWKTLLKLQTEKRIILSGTPFQNNFDELFNTLHLVRPGIIEKEKAFAGMVSSRRRYSKRPRAEREYSVHDSRTKEVDQAIEIEKIKCIMQPFVHVHKGSILRKSLPGLTDCVILLDPQPLQKNLIEKLEYSENSFELGYKVAFLSVHPSLAEHCWSSEYESSEVNQEMLKDLRHDSGVGVKTKFIMALVQFSRAMNEKVLIFSQYIFPLKLIMDQLKAKFGWHEGKEVLQMQGSQDQLQRQTAISIFNNPNSEAKVLLAATKCSSEGINLVGASRVVLLDVVWNPSVERQAISRAYRLGQKKVVYTYHLITSGTNEGDKYCRQVEKDRLSELVFSAAHKENDEPRVHTTFEDRILEKMVSDADLTDMFLKIIYKPKEANLIETFGLVAPA